MTAHPLTHRIVLATHNQGKVAEFAQLLGPYGHEIVSAGSLGLPSPEETGATFVENAILKAEAAARTTGNLALADDSGICVNALGGQPGLYSARWAEPSKDFRVAMDRVQRELGNNADRSAFFICVLALVWPDGHSETVAGRINGIIARERRGTQGHGYDPIFIPENFTTTFAEMGGEAKNAISHRGRATAALIDKFFKKN